MPGKIRTFSLYPSDNIILPQIETWVTPPSSFSLKVLDECYARNKEFVAVMFQTDERDNLKPVSTGCICEVEKISGEGEGRSFYLKGKQPFRLWDNNGVVETGDNVLGKGQIIEEPILDYESDEFISLSGQFRELDDSTCDLIDKYAEGNSNRFFAAAMDNFLPYNYVADKVKLDFMGAEDLPSKIAALEAAIKLAFDAAEYTKGMNLYKYEHYEDAIEQWNNSLEENNVYRTPATIYSIFAYCFLKKHAEAIDLYNASADFLPEDSDLMFNIASAYYAMGNKEGTAVFLQEYLSLLPHSDGRLLIFYGNSNYKLPQSYKEFIADGMESGLSPFILTEYILPLINDSRVVTSAFFDELLMDKGRDGQREIDIMTALLKKKYDIRSEVSTTITNNGDQLICLPKMYFYKDEKFVKVFENFKKEFKRILIQHGPDEAFKYQFNEEGNILGYPECCIERSVELRHGTYTGTTFEKDLSRSIILERNIFRRADLTSLYAMEFYPCAIDCSKAHSKGEEILNILYDYDPQAYNIYSNVILTMHEEQVLSWSNPSTYRLREYTDTEICRLLELEWMGYEHLRNILDNTDYKIGFFNP